MPQTLSRRAALREPLSHSGGMGKTNCETEEAELYCCLCRRRATAVPQLALKPRSLPKHVLNRQKRCPAAKGTGDNMRMGSHD